MGLALLMPATAAAQSGVGIGPVVGYEYGVPLDINRTPGVINSRPGFSGSGTSSNHTGWFGATGLFPVADHFNLSATLALGTSRGIFTSDPFPIDPILDSIGGTVIPRHQFQVETMSSHLLLDLQFRYRVGPLLELGLGGWLRQRLFSHFIRIEDSVDDGGTMLNTSSRSIITADSLASGSLRGGLDVAAAATIRITPAMDIQPRLYTRLDLVALGGGESVAHSLSIGGALALLFDASGNASPEGDISDRTPPPVPIAPARSPDHPPLLEASIDLYSGDAGGGDSGSVVVQTSDVIHRLRMPLIPVILFDRDSAALPGRYARLSPSAVEGFSARSLAGLEPGEVYYHVLNIVGMRLRNERSGGIILVGSSSADEPPEMAGKRARAVADYLQDIWGVESERITIRTDHPAATEGVQRSVRLLHAPAAVTAPVLTQWIARELHAPSIGIRPYINAEAGVREWAIVITQGKREVARYTSRDPDPFDGVDLAFLKEQETDSTLLPLVATLTVRDSAGTTRVASDRLALRWDPSSSGSGGGEGKREMLRYLMMDPGHDSTIAPASRTLFQNLSQAVRQGARLTISPLGNGGEMPVGSLWTTANVAGDLVALLRKRGIEPAGFQVVGATAPASEGAAIPSPLASGTQVMVEQEADSGDSGRQ